MMTKRVAALAVASGLALLGGSAMGGSALAAERIVDPPRLKPGATDTAEKDWAQRNLDRDGWAMVGNGSLTVWFVPVETSAQNAYPVVRDWVRIEEAGPSPAIIARLSSLVMMEVDCAKSTARTLRTIAYSHNNLRGRISADFDDEAAKPISMPPGSLGDMTLKAICRAAEASAPGPAEEQGQ